jgi:hypothetical protein
MSRLQDLVADTVSNRLFRAMRVTHVCDRGPFQEISMTTVASGVSSWTPGDKIQVRVPGGGLTMRTYTPIRWDNTSGDTTILVHLHGAGPGSAWAHAVADGDAVQIVGPRRSIDLTRFTSAPIFVGDETAVGLRVAWTAAHPNLEPVRDNFELNSPTHPPMRYRFTVRALRHRVGLRIQRCFRPDMLCDARPEWCRDDDSGGPVATWRRAISEIGRQVSACTTSVMPTPRLRADERDHPPPKR